MANEEEVFVTNRTAAKHFFIHGSLGAFYNGLLNWFGNHFYDRLNYRVIGTYEKSIEYFNKKLELGKEVDQNIFPSITLDPSLDVDYAATSGAMLWQKPYLSPGLAGKLWERVPGLEDQDIVLTPIFSRLAGAIEVTFWLNSVYENLDLRTELLLFSGGLDRYMRPDTFMSHIILPDNLINFEVDGNRIDWSQTPLVIKLIKAANVYRYALPVKLDPYFKFTNIADSSTKYGGDTLAEYKLSATIEYEINLPTYVVLYTDLTGFIDLRFEMTSAYSRYGRNPVYNEETNSYDPNPNKLDQLFGLRMSRDDKSALHKIEDVSDYGFYEFTQDDLDEYDNLPEEETWKLIIPNPFPGTPIKQLRVISYTGELEYEREWLINESDEFEIYIKPIVGEVVEMHKYIEREEQPPK